MNEKKIIRQNAISKQRIVFLLKIAALLLGITVALIGIFFLIGWQFNIIVLQTFAFGLMPMNPLCAVEFILCGLSICASSFASSAFARRFSFFLAFLVIVLAFLKFLEIFGINIPIDQFFLSDKLGNLMPPSRMPPITAINFILIGLSIIFIDTNYRGRSLAQYLAITSGSFALFMLLAYLFNSSFSSPFIFFSPLALHGVIDFILLTLAILLLRPDTGVIAIFMSARRGGMLARRLGPLTLIMPIALAYVGNIMARAGFFDLQLGFALVLVLNIVIFEFFNLRYSLMADSLEVKQEEDEQAIRQAKILDDALLQSIGEGVVATDREGVVILFNGEAEKMFGINAKKAIGKSIFKILSIYDKDNKILAKKDRPLQISLTTGKTVTSSVSNPYYFAIGDKKIPVAISVTPVIYNGNTAGVVDVFRDISNDIEIDQAKSEFVSFASHQLRTPSTAIGWLIEIFLEKYGDKLDGEQRATIEEIYRENQQIADLITDFLNVSKIEYGISAVQSTPVDTVPIINSILNEQFRVRINEKKIKTEEKIDQDLCVINVDTNLFRLIVENLISNAIKYTPENGKITVELVRFKAGDVLGNRKLSKNTCVFVVADTGYGIPKDEQDKIFTKFYRTNIARSKNIPGTGLGLYMVKLFIGKMGGEIWFESEENKGTKFFVEF